MPFSALAKKCPGCGVEFTVDLDRAEGPPTRLGARLQALVGSITVLCSDCGERDDAEREGRRQAQLVRSRRGAALIPEALRHVTFDSLERDAQRAAAIADGERWARGDIDGLVLGGEVGAGKTWIAAAAANQRVELAPLRWVSMPALLAKAVASDDQAKRQAMDILIGGVGAVVLDDIDKVNSRSEWAMAQVFLAVDNAVQHRRPLLVTTNLGADELTAKIGEPVVSRLTGYCSTHRIAGADRRQAA